jgi:hypothetical protein
MWELQESSGADENYRLSRQFRRPEHLGAGPFSELHSPVLNLSITRTFFT